VEERSLTENASLGILSSGVVQTLCYTFCSNRLFCVHFMFFWFNICEKQGSLAYFEFGFAYCQLGLANIMPIILKKETKIWANRFAKKLRLKIKTMLKLKIFENKLIWE